MSDPPNMVDQAVAAAARHLRDTIEIRLNGDPRDPHDRLRWETLWGACVHHQPLSITAPLWENVPRTVFVKHVSPYYAGRWYAWLHDLPTQITVAPLLPG